MTSSPQDLEDLLVGYVSKALEMRERGELISLDELCREHPELIASVADAIADAPQLARLAASAQEHDPLLGREFDNRYRLDARLGAGAMGIVYRATDLRLGRAVAVKVLRPELFGGRDAEQRFVREAEVLAKLRHGNVVAVYDTGRTGDGVAFLVMELLSGQPLVALLGEHERRAEAGGTGSLDDMSFVAAALREAPQFEQTWLRQTVKWTAELARGLAEAHRLGVLHRDVKPSNVFVGSDGQARVIDFGVAASESHATITAADGGALGTPAYMAPEVIVGQAAASPASDVYGLGATLYHLLTRRPPYLGTVTNVIASIQRRDPIPVGRLRPGLPRDLHAIVDRAMARNPKQRYASMGDFAADLRAFLGHQPVAARPVTSVARMWRKASRDPLARALGLVVGLALVGLVVAMFVSAWRLRRSNEYDATMAAIPPGLGIELPDLRQIRDETERRAILGLLDRAVALAAEPVPARMLRAAFLLDHGDARGAAAEVAVIADTYRTEFSRVLAGRYRQLVDNAGAGTPVLDVSDLPEPQTGPDRYLMAYQLLRSGRGEAVDDRIVQLFENADPEWLAGQEMLANAILAKASRAAIQGDAFATRDHVTRVLQIVTNVEVRRGRRTALTANQLGTNLLLQQRVSEALSILSEGCSLCPWSNGLLRNLAKAQSQAGDHESAVATCQRAIALRPAFIDNYRLLGSLLAANRDYVGSRAAAAAVPIAPGPVGDAIRQELSGLNENAIALQQLASGDFSGAAESARASVAALTAAGKTSSLEFEVSRDLAAGDMPALFETLLRRWSRQPTSWLMTANLTQVLRKLQTDSNGVGVRHLDLLTQGLRLLAQSQSPSRVLY